MLSSSKIKAKYRGMTKEEIIEQWSGNSEYYDQGHATFVRYITSELQEKQDIAEPPKIGKAFRTWRSKLDALGLDIFRVYWPIHNGRINACPDIVAVYREQPVDEVLELHLVSLSRAADITLRNKFNEKLKAPFAHLPDTVYHTSSIRLTLEQTVLESYTDLVYKGKTYPRCSVVTRELVTIPQNGGSFASIPINEERVDAWRLESLLEAQLKPQDI